MSFWYDNYDDDLRFPTIMFGFNTTENYTNNIENASDDKEAKWNFAFWLQNEIERIGEKGDKLLEDWFRASDYFYTEEEDERANKNETLFTEILNKGDKFSNEFIEEIITLTKRLFSESIISSKFGKKIPILIHELEYYDLPISWTVRSNPDGLVDEFIEWTRTF
ncbi:MAG: hypothetical protein EOO43_13205 [Flavobacterium sp.]|nr:MAG: hypothetical protein EOO43_13205 [Flavobacterium sp.]